MKHEPDAVDRFWAEHAAGGPSHVVLAIAVHKEGSDGDWFGIFSTIAKAQAWSDGVGKEYSGAVFAPYVVDAPEYGNGPKGAEQW